MFRSRRSALEFAIRWRTCPPRELPGPPEKMKAHLEKCRWCAEAGDITNEDDPWLEIVRQFKACMNRSEVVGQPEPGSICFLQQALARWQGSDYYNPPMILVTERIEAPETIFKVAQCYCDLLLAGPGDLILEPERSGGIELFVECWNTYLVRGIDLEESLAQVADGVLEAILDMENDPGAEIDWAPLSMPLQQDDPRLIFRKMEQDVAGIFTSTAIEAYPFLFDELAARCRLQSPAALRRAAVGMPVSLEFSEPSLGVTEMLALANPAPESLPLAAASDGSGRVPVRHWRIGPEGIAGFAFLEAEVFKSSFDGNVCKLTGRVLNLPKLSAATFLCAFVERPGQQPVPARTSWDRETGSLLVEVSGDDEVCQQTEKRLAMALIEFTGALPG